MIMKVYALKIDNAISCFSVAYNLDQALKLYKGFIPSFEDPAARTSFLNSELLEIIEVDVLTGQIYPHEDNTSISLGILSELIEVLPDNSIEESEV